MVQQGAMTQPRLIAGLLCARSPRRSTALLRWALIPTLQWRSRDPGDPAGELGQLLRPPARAPGTLHAARPPEAVGRMCPESADSLSSLAGLRLAPVVKRRSCPKAVETSSPGAQAPGLCATPLGPPTRETEGLT